MAFGRGPLDHSVSPGRIWCRFFRYCEEIARDELGFGEECVCGAVRGAEAAPPAQYSSKVSSQSSTDEVKAKANLPSEEVDFRADKTSNSCVRHKIRHSQKEKSAPRPVHAVLPSNFVNTWHKNESFSSFLPSLFSAYTSAFRKGVQPLTWDDTQELLLSVCYPQTPNFI